LKERRLRSATEQAFFAPRTNRTPTEQAFFAPCKGLAKAEQAFFAPYMGLAKAEQACSFGRKACAATAGTGPQGRSPKSPAQRQGKGARNGTGQGEEVGFGESAHGSSGLGDLSLRGFSVWGSQSIGIESESPNEFIDRDEIGLLPLGRSSTISSGQ